MAIPENTLYNSFEFNFPSRDIDPARKGDVYCRANSKSIMSLFLRNKTAWGVNGYKDFSIARDYSRGTQDTSQYKSWLLNDAAYDDGFTASVGNSDTFDDTPVGRISRKEGWMNMIFDNVSPAPALMNSIHGLMDRMDWDLFVDTIDEKSKKLKEQQKFTKLVASQNADWQVPYKKDAGIAVDEDVVFPKSVEELEMYEAKDGFKLNVARAMQKLLRHSFNISMWDGGIRRKIVDDLITLGYGACRDVFNTENNKWEIKYLDPARLVIQYSNEFDYDDSEYAGYFCYWTISNLRDKLPNVAEVEFQNLAKACYTLYGNPRDRWQNFYSELDPTTGTYRYDGFKVPVFECEWMDTDIQKKLYYTSVRGRDSIIDLDWDSTVTPLKDDKLKAGANQEVKHIFKRVVRQCFWVLNTDFVFDYGIVNMAAREGLSKPHLTFHVEQLLQPCIIKRIIPILDQISMLFLRWQNSLAMMVERGYAVNTSMLTNIAFGGKKLSPADVLKLWQQTGRLLFSYANTPTGMYSGGNPLPIIPMEGGLGDRVKENMEAMQMQFDLLAKVVGFDLLSISTPNPNVPAGNQEIAEQNMNNILKPIVFSLEKIKGSVGTSVMRRLQIGLRNNDKIREAYAGVITGGDMDAMISMESEGVQYGMELKPRPDQKQKARFEQWINIALQNTREQRPGIDLNDAIAFMSRLENGDDVLELEKQLEYAIEKNKQIADQQQKAVIQQQGEQQQQAQQMQAQQQQQLLQSETQGKIAEEQVRGNIKSDTTATEQNFNLLQMLMEAANAEQGIQTGGGSHR